eukprot:jgi/Botrbrau1/14304/Bobra.0207s0009.1
MISNLFACLASVMHCTLLHRIITKLLHIHRYLVLCTCMLHSWSTNRTVLVLIKMQ